jgi:hypothetical protein
MALLGGVLAANPLIDQNAVQNHVVRRSLRRQKVYLDRENPLETYKYAESEIRIRYRFNSHSIYYICSLVEEELAHPTKKSAALPVLYQVLLALKFYATGDFYTTIGDSIKVHRSTSCRAVFRVSVALVGLSKRVVVFPTGDQLDATKRAFGKISGFPGVVGCVDGSLIRIQKQARNGDDYICRKHFPAINIQVKRFTFSNIRLGASDGNSFC